MQEPKLITYGFLLPPRGEEEKWRSIDLRDFSYYGSRRYRYNVFENFCSKYLKLSGIDATDYDSPYKYCIQQLGWCRVGNLCFPAELITITGGPAFHQEIFDYYNAHGYEFDFVPMAGPMD